VTRPEGAVVSVVDAGIVDAGRGVAVVVCVGHLLSVCVDVTGVSTTLFSTAGVVAVGRRDVAGCVDVSDLSATTGVVDVVVVGGATMAMTGAEAGAFSANIEEGGFAQVPVVLGAAATGVVVAGVDPGAGILTADWFVV